MSSPLFSHHAAARSLQVFGLYLCATGSALLLAPALVLAPLGLAVPQDVWIRLLGIVALALGGCDLLAGRDALMTLLRWSVWRRSMAGVTIAGLVAAGLAPAALLLFAAVDMAAALWTGLALRSPAANPPAKPPTNPPANRLNAA